MAATIDSGSFRHWIGRSEVAEDVIAIERVRAFAATIAGVFAAEQVIDPSRILLFRYSALTFNSHRIHYDLDYAMKEEGYEGLVVHGPLQATLLLH